MSLLRQSSGLALALAVSLLAAAPARADEAGPVTLHVENQPLNEVLDALVKSHGLNYVVSGTSIKAAGNVYCHLDKVPLDRAVQMLCAACNLEAEIQGRFVVIRVPRGSKARFAFPSERELADARRRESSADKAGTSGKGGAMFAGEGRESSEASRSGKTSADPTGKTGSADSPPSGTEGRDEEDESTAAFATGKVLSKTDSSVVIKSELDDTVATYLMPAPKPGNETFLLTLRQGIGRLSVGNRASVTFKTDARGRKTLTGIIGGRDPRDRSTVTLPGKTGDSTESGD